MSLIKAREVAVFAVLRSHKIHGYAVASFFTTGPLRLLGLSRAATYAIIERFRKRGWVTGTRHAGDAYPDREILDLDAPEAEFSDLIQTLVTQDTLPTAPLMAVALLLDAGVPVGATVIDQQIREREKILARWAKDHDHAETLTMTLAVGYLRAEIDALTRAKATIND